MADHVVAPVAGHPADPAPVITESEQKTLDEINMIHAFISTTFSRYRKMSPQLRSQLFIDKLYLIVSALPILTGSGHIEKNKIVKETIDKQLTEIQSYFMEELNMLNDHIMSKSTSAVIEINKKLDAVMLSPDCVEGAELMKQSKTDFEEKIKTI